MKHLEALQSLGCTPIAVPARSERIPELRSMGFLAVQTLHDAALIGAEAVIIATDTKRHPDDCRTALNLGLHVLVEKPIAASVVEAQDLPLLAKSKNLRLAVAFCLRFDPGLEEVRSRLAELGAPLAVTIECRSFLPSWRPNRDYRLSYSARRNEGGVLLDLIHEIDYSVWLFGVPELVFGMMRNTGTLKIETEDIVQAVWRVANGTYVSVGLDYLSRLRQRHMSVQWDTCRLEFDFLSGHLSIQRSDSNNLDKQFPRNTKQLYVEQTQHFLHLIESDITLPLLPTDADTLIAQSVCDAIRRSAQSGDSVRINL